MATCNTHIPTNRGQTTYANVRHVPTAVFSWSSFEIKPKAECYCKMARLFVSVGGEIKNAADAQKVTVELRQELFSRTASHETGAKSGATHLKTQWAKTGVGK